MLKRVRHYLNNIDDLSKERLILVGVSGGPDSLCLLNILHQLDYLLMVAHFNHGLRAESGEEARLVEEISDAMGIAFVSGGQETATYAAARGLSIEEAARILRYRFLFGQARELDAQAIAVGHNADDQVETVLMHLLRGAGLDGLTGMQTAVLPNAWSDEITLLRPILSIWRLEILDYCVRQNLQPIIDSSNADRTFFRNRLRHDLIPLLDDYVPGISERVWRMAATLQGDHNIVKKVVARAWDNCVLEQGSGYISFSEKIFLQQPVGVQRRLVRTVVNVLRTNLRDLNYDAVDRALTFVAMPPHSGQADFCLGLRLILENGRFYIAAWEADLPCVSWPQLADDEPYTLSIPGRLDLAHGWFFTAKHVEDMTRARNQAEENVDPFQAWISIEEQRSTVTLRPRRAGDRFAPMGMDGKSAKISDFMINRKLPRRARASWPLVCIDAEIAWLPGYRLGEAFQLTAEIQNAFHLRLTWSGENIKGVVG